MAHIQNIYPERFQIGESHPEDCTCRVCIRLAYLLEEIKKTSPFRLPREKNLTKSCWILSKVMKEAFKDLIDDSAEIIPVEEKHEEICDCLQCSIVDYLGQYLQESGEPETPQDNTSDDGILQRDVETALVYGTEKAIAINTTNGEIASAYDVSSHLDIPINIKKNCEKDENVMTSQLKETTLEEIADTCVCGKGVVSKVCLRHIPAFCQYAANKLDEEGCFCCDGYKCSYCQRLECFECQHEETELYDCLKQMYSNTSGMTEKMSQWLDVKLKAAGKIFDLPKNKPETDFSLDIEQEKDLGDQLADSLEREVVQEWSWNPTTVGEAFDLTDRMTEEILNVNELFDLRSWPRCYRLKVKVEEDGTKRLEEVYCELELESWKQPTTFVEDTFPLGSNGLPPPEDIFTKEAEIKNPLSERMRKSMPRRSNKKVVGIDALWQPIVKYVGVNEKKSRWTKEEKEAKCRELIYRLEQNCPKVDEATEVPQYERVQSILDRYCESPFLAPELPIPLSEDELADWMKGIKAIVPNDQRLGYVEEFWEGLEKWKPDPGENELRRKLIEEVKDFRKRVNPLRKAASTTRESQTSSNYSAWSSLVDGIIDSLPEELREELISIKMEVSDKWLGEGRLAELESSLMSGQCDSQCGDTEELPEEEESVPKPITSKETTVEDEPPPTLDNVPRYDDEEDVLEDGEVLPTNMKERWEKEVKELLESLEEENTKASAIDIDREMRHGSAKLLELPLTPCPYMKEMMQKMVNYNNGELHPIQKFWKEHPFFPFWTPSVLYDLSDIERVAFGNTEELEAESDFDETLLDDLEKSVLFADQPKETAEEPVTTSDKSKVDEIEDLLNLLQIEEDKWEKCVKNEADENDQRSSTSPGTITLEHLKQGIAGPVRSTALFALELDSSCQFDMSAIIPDPAHSWSFALDTFQKQAIVALEASLNVFVLAHTSAGKTAAAEYTIGMAERNGSKVIYTSPIKALSNQKYKDFKDTFKNRISVGIITGDVQLNEDAQCLIMTTEILRSMIYNHSSRLNELEFVIFDEVHYFNDPERGNVWEEVLILLPNKCQILMLSATVANPMDFASWVGRRKERTVVVTKTTHRPTPLKHYLHVGTTAQTTVLSFPLEIGNGFCYENFNQGMNLKKSLEENMKLSKPTNASQSKNWNNFIKYHLIKRNCLPAVIFSFSRKKCDMYASYLSKIDLTTSPTDAASITDFIQKNIMKLSASDQRIPQIVKMTSLLIRGIGVHHSGVLPLLKEIVEVLFQSGKVRLLFATETFAMGVNMPARTVVFSSVQKFDGEDWRELKPAEYTQMAGRAGRRGKDRSGKVIILAWDRRFITPKSSCLAKMMTSESETLQSRFRLRYSMILNTLSSQGDLSIHRILNSTFLEHCIKPIIEMKKKHTEELKNAIQNVEEVVDQMLSPEVKKILSDYFSCCKEFVNLTQSVRGELLKNTKLVQYLREGRIVLISHMKYSIVFGIIVEVDSSCVCKVLIVKEYVYNIPSLMSRHSLATEMQERIWKFAVGYRPEMYSLCYPMEKSGIEFVEIQPNEIIGFISNEGLPITRNVINAMHSLGNLQQQPLRIADGIMLDMLVHDIHERARNALCYQNNYVDEEAILTINLMDEKKGRYRQYVNQLKYLSAKVVTAPLNFECNMETLLDFFWTWIGKEELKSQETMLESKTGRIALLPDYENKLELLKRRNFLEKDEMLTMQGNIASRIPTHELFITEILLKNMMDKLNAFEVAALLSCLVFQDNNKMSQEGVENDKGISVRDSMLSDSARRTVKKAEQKLTKMKSTITYTGAELAEIEGKEEVEVAETQLQKLERSLPVHLKQAVSDLTNLRDELDEEEKELNITNSEISKISFRLVPVIYEWARGKPFQHVMDIVKDLTQEGILVRWIQQLIEALKDIESASRLMGDPNTTTKLINAAASLKRGIVYHQSLYLD